MNHGKSCAPWPESYELILRHLWKEGYSASQIAKKMNGEPLRAGLTRNAVIPFITRTDLHCPMFCEGEEGPDGLICGAAIELTQRWCAHCVRLVYTPVTPAAKRKLAA